MFCTRCQNEVPDCECDDISERLERLADIDGFATDRCTDCGHHAVDCTCGGGG